MNMELDAKGRFVQHRRPAGRGLIRALIVIALVLGVAVGLLIIAAEDAVGQPLPPHFTDKTRDTSGVLSLAEDPKDWVFGFTDTIDEVTVSPAGLNVVYLIRQWDAYVIECARDSGSVQALGEYDSVASAHYGVGMYRLEWVKRALPRDPTFGGFVEHLRKILTPIMLQDPEFKDNMPWRVENR
jgi:hypothetical protein